ncbi:MAG: DUF4139 domain-containing protein [Proteobacteria bacterium]|nr:DUF4139 domain-containing protein [Pseudomonadota bacterium]
MAHMHSTLARGRIAVLAFAFALPLLGSVPGAAMGAEALALKRVMLSTGGVGYFEYEATITGNAELSLIVRLDQVDDVLKSIVVFDEKGGAASIGLAGREPLSQIFRGLPIKARDFASPAALLNALQGAKVRTSGPRQIEGRLIRVVAETQRLGQGGGTITRHRVSVMTERGLEQFILEEAGSLRFVDPGLQAKINAGLDAIANHRLRDRRTIHIATTGEGQRTIRVGYVVGVPLWKASYRLTLPNDDAKGHLQGWAVIENMSGKDWNGVELTLVSGNPVTFRQALYTAYYVDRPEVPVEVMGRILPRPDTGAVGAVPGQAAIEGDFRQQGRLGEIRGGRADAARGLARKSKSSADFEKKPRSRAFAQERLEAGMMRDVVSEPVSRSVANMLPARAEATEALSQVVFRLPMGVTIKAGHSMMTPIIDRELPAERLAYYQPGTHPRHPLAAVILTNDTKTGLPPGALTLYERAGAKGATGYLGDAQMNGLPAGEERIVSYALDGKTRIDREVKRRQTIAKGKILHGVFELTYLEQQSTTYRVKAPAREDRRLLFEHPRTPGWTLAKPPEKETKLTDKHYRIRYRIEKGREASFEVVLERPRLSKIVLNGLSTAQLVGYAKTGKLDDGLRQAFARMAELKRQVESQEHRLKRATEDQQEIFKDQKRIRDNLYRIPRNTDLHRRYLTKLDAQENKLERTLKEIEAAKKDVDRTKKALADYIGKLKL